jgi:3-phosphoshikimate 1-carboxyvinyltransferase
VSDLVVHPAGRPLFGSVPVPPDKSIAHRAFLLASVAEGTSRVRGADLGGDNQSTLAALRALGVDVERDGAETRVTGRGLRGWRAPAADLDCGNSGTTMRMLAGMLVAQPFPSRLIGDASLSRRPMDRVARPLRLRGARIEGRIDAARPGETTAPLSIEPLPAVQPLSAIEYEMPVASAQVKSALLLSGMWADGPTWLREATVSRDHTERMMRALGVPVHGVGGMVELDPSSWSRGLPAFELVVPGDVSAAAFLLAAAQLVPESRVDLRAVGHNPTRTGLFEVLRDMGGALQVTPRGDELGEPVADLAAASAPLAGVRVGGETLLRAIDEVPVVCALAARARGTTTIGEAAELRVKESDRIAAMVRVLRAFGVGVEERADGMVVEGRPEGALSPAVIDSEGDHRVAMSAAVLALVGGGPSRIRNADCIAVSFPRFVGTLRALGATLEVTS